MEIIEVLKFSFIVGLISLDSRNIGSFGISRPLICGIILGMIFNDLSLGIYVGLILEILTINLMPVGNFVAPVGSVITGVIFFLCNKFYIDATEFFLPVIFLYGFIIAHVSRGMSKFLWILNNSLVEKFILQVRKGKIHFCIFNIISIFFTVLVFSGLTFGSIMVGEVVLKYLLDFVLNNFVSKNILKFLLSYLPLFVMIFFLNMFDIPQKILFVIIGVVITFLLSQFVVGALNIFLLNFIVSIFFVILITRLSEAWRRA